MKKIVGFRPQIMSSPGVGSLRVSLIQGNIPETQSLHHNHAQTPSNSVNGDDIDTTLRLSSNYIPVPSVNVNVLRNPLLGSLDGDDDDEVDTSLTLSPPGSRTKKSTRTMAKPRNDDDDQVNLGLPGSLSSKKKSTRNIRDDLDQEDTTGALFTISDAVYNLTLLPWFWRTVASSTAHDHSQVVPKAVTPISDRVYNPTPLRCYFTGVGFSTAHDQNQADAVASTSDATPLATINKKKRKRMRRDADGGEQRPPRRRRNNARDAEINQQPLVPIEEIPGLIQTIELRGGSGPVFLYRKKLEMSDVDKGQNRLFVTRGERVMEFLREEEVADMTDKDGKGIKIVGVDGGGEVYEKIGLKKWESVKMIVINSEWRRVVAQNNAEAGDAVEIWGYRENQKPCLAFNFRKERHGDDIV